MRGAVMQCPCYDFGGSDAERAALRIAPPRHGHHRRDRVGRLQTPVMWGVPVRWGCAHTPANAVQGFRLLGRRGVQRIVRR